jgi:hypothetical protein
MLSVGEGELWMLSTPCGKRGFFYETWEHGGRSAQAEGFVVRDPQIESWLRVRVPATDCPRISQHFLEEQRSVMTSDAFHQEHMCEFTGSGDALFDPGLIAAAFDDDLEPV